MVSPEASFPALQKVTILLCLHMNFSLFESLLVPLFMGSVVILVGPTLITSLQLQLFKGPTSRYSHRASVIQPINFGGYNSVIPLPLQGNLLSPHTYFHSFRCGYSARCDQLQYNNNRCISSLKALNILWK